MIFLVRHGEAAASWGDHPDPGLSDLGRKQAERVGKDLEQQGAASVISSPMQRCRETAAPLAVARGLTPVILPQVSEIATPEGVSDRVTWLQTYMAGTWASEGRQHVAWRDGMLESLADIPDNTAIFTHFVAINAIVSALTGKPETIVFRPGHCSVTTLTRQDGELKLQELGSESATRVL